jgi:methyl-accepting chemotaxis protein
MKEHRGMRFSIGLRIILGSIVLNILVCAVMGISINRAVSQSFINRASEDTLALTQVAAYQINGNLLSVLETGSDESYANTVVLDQLSHVSENADLNAIYTIGKRNGQLVYLSRPVNDNISIGTAVESEFTEEMEKALSSGGSVSQTIRKGSNGNSYITAYSPILNNDGQVVGLLGLDYIVNDLVEALDQIVRSIIIIGLILSVIAVVISIVLSKTITRKLATVNGKIHDLVNNDGDLTHELEISGNDETTDIADNVNDLLRYIRGVVVTINDSSNKLSGSVESALETTIRTNDQLTGVSATMEQMSAAMEETSASLQQVQGSTSKIKGDVQEMFGSVQNGTSYAGDMESRAIDMRKHAENETEAARQATEHMTESLNEKIEKSKAVESISDLTQTILDIASQTNLLSLNASIEAARAGEHGRGFAVVAEEISGLATNSADTAKKIQVISQEVIGNVRDLADEATKMVDFVRDKTIGGYQQLMDTGVQYQDDAEKISEMLRNVDTASQNIENSMNMVTQAMDGVSTAVEESANGITNVAAAVADMSDNMRQNKKVINENAEIAQQLDGEVNKFKF